MTRLFNLPTLLSLFVFTLFGFSSDTLQAATLNVADNLIVSEVDNQAIEHSFFSQKSTFELGKGAHVLIVRYKDVFEDLDFAQDRVVESKKFVVKFSITAEQRLSLSTIAIKDLAHAQSFARAPEISIKDQHNAQLDITLEKVADYKLAKQINIVVDALTSKQASEKINSASLSNLITENTSNKVTAAKKISNNTLTQVNSLTMLKFWWKNASNEEKAYFEKYIKIHN